MNENIEIPKTIDHYNIIKRIEKGGMGEVYLALDTICERKIALKRIRPDIKKIKGIKDRFLEEAKITGQLSHPSIIPVYSIKNKGNSIYYTMPFVEGDTLKQILRRTRQLEKEGKEADPIGGSIPTLARIFLQVCEAVAYAHSKGVLHRDLKPENIIIGKYGEVLILDWGLAKAFENNRRKKIPSREKENSLHSSSSNCTAFGKAMGTISYMAPERAFNNPASISSDIYALGVILFQILTLHFPFHRKSLREFRKIAESEKLVNPIELAPYRDIPKMLSRIAEKCLMYNPKKRYQNADFLIRDLKNYIEGCSEWFPIAKLNLKNKKHWTFQENILLAEHVAITGTTELAEWVYMMISKESFTENIKINADIRIREKGNGLGLLLCVPEKVEKTSPEFGYCLWIGSDLQPSTKLYRSTVEAMHLPDVYLSRNKWHSISIEKIDNNIYFTLNNKRNFSYISYLPLVGTRVGLLYRDADFEIKNFQVSVGGLHAKVNCLAIPDAFLANKNFDKALLEYQRIGYSFLGRFEGREAMFRSGITLIEKARHSESHTEKENILQTAWEEFEKLHPTPGAPLGYLGKSLIYKFLEEEEEEVKCLEMACRKYKKHPLLPIIREQIIHRMHQCSYHNRQGAYFFLFLVARHIPTSVSSNDTQKLISSLRKHWEPLRFIEKLPAQEYSPSVDHAQFCMILAFWLKKPYALLEIIQDLYDTDRLASTCIFNGLFCLLEMGYHSIVYKQIRYLQSPPQKTEEEFSSALSCLKTAALCHRENLKQAIENFFSSSPKKLRKREERTLLYLLEQMLSSRKLDLIHQTHDRLQNHSLSESSSIQSDAYRIWASLLQNKWDQARKSFQKYPLEFINEETTILRFLYICLLQVKEHEKLTSIFHSDALNKPFPRSYSLAAYYLSAENKKQKIYIKRAFSWEKKHLYRQLSLFYHCLNEKEKSLYYLNLEQKENKHNVSE